MKKIVSIKQDEPGFYIKAGIKMAGRAGIEISEKCPYQEAQIIHQAYAKGWIIPVAHMLETEYMWEELSS